MQQQTQCQTAPKMSLHPHDAIEQNNLAVEELKQGGDLSKAFELLCRAGEIIEKSEKEHHDQHGRVDDSSKEEPTLHFTWEDCSKALTTKVLPKSLLTNNGSIPFLCHNKFLRIDSDMDYDGDTELEPMCPCGFSWAIWYNFGMLSAACGVFAGEIAGRTFLQNASDLLEHVYNRAELEIKFYASSSPAWCRWWTRVQLAILNDQACMFQECGMYDEAFEYLDMSRQKLIAVYSQLDYGVWAEFYLNLEIMLRNKGGAAA